MAQHKETLVRASTRSTERAPGYYVMLRPHSLEVLALLEVETRGVTFIGVDTDTERSLLGKVAALTMRGISLRHALDLVAREIGCVLQPVSSGDGKERPPTRGLGSTPPLVAVHNPRPEKLLGRRRETRERRGEVWDQEG